MDVVTFRSLWRQALGLMFQKPKKETLYVFDFGRSLKVSFHMFFVFWSIDLYLLNKERRVVEVKRGFRPFSVFYPKEEFWYAVETSPGLLRKKRGALLRF